MTDALTLTGVTKRFGGFDLAIDLRVPRGLVTGFVGANGAGKTTTIKLALGLVHPDGGRIEIEDHSRLAVVLDQAPYNANWTVRQTGRVLSRFYPSWDAARFASLTDGHGVPGDRLVRELSRGMGMRLQLAAALSHDADFLILDEPTAGLDPLARDELLDALSDFMVTEGHTILFSSHITSDLDRLADRIVLIDHGRVLEDADTDDLVAKYRLVAGPASALSAGLRPHLLGLRQSNVGWDALAPVSVAEGAVGLSLEQPTLNDIVVRTAKENAHV